MHTLAIDIGGTKFSACVFDGDQIVRRHSGGDGPRRRA
jgi:predicted NBD/HSP70 family sugar kinase